MDQRKVGTIRSEEAQIREFWSSHPCGDHLVGGLDARYEGEFDTFFTEYDRFRYSLEDHIPRCLDELHVAGSRVLEIGLGQGAESEQLIRRGASWTGVDLTEESVARVRTRLELRNLPYDALSQGSVLDLPFDDDSFDVVFSHGVLHHVPDILGAQREICRVLRPGGELVAMMYARRSLNYYVAIGIVRRAAVAVGYPFASVLPADGMLAAHIQNAQRIGLRKYLRMEEFIHYNTDGPENPFARVYDRTRLEHDFPDFVVTRTYQRFMHAPPLPVHRLPGATAVGWHLWAHLRPRPTHST
jgi:ubiquinone/menaquinone biosynthesis C-methylase UbiE